MFCVNCGTTLVVDSVVCHKCASPVGGHPLAAKSSNTWKIILGVVGVLIGLPIVFLIVALITGSLYMRSAEKLGDELSAVGAMENIPKFQTQYASRHKGSFGTFDELVQGVGMDEKFRGNRPVVYGYTFTMDVFAPSNEIPGGFFSIKADPVNSKGPRYYTDSRIKRITTTNEDRAATADDPIYRKL